MDQIVRREHLETIENANSTLDYIVTFTGVISDTVSVQVRYVPDQAILKPESLHTYLAALGSVDWTHLENLGLTILNDLNNELVPRWVQVTVLGTSHDLNHEVKVEDRQPRWDNPVLLSRIGPG